MDIRIETITPAAATNYINANRSNRKLRNGVVERYADDMKNGRWTDCLVEPIPAGEARELHGRELIDALREHFGWHLTRRDELQALRDEMTERELVATVPMRFDPLFNTRPAPRWVPAWEVE